MPPDLAHDRGHRERHEIGSGLDVEAHHRIDQPDPGDLDEVVARFAAALESPGDVVGQRQAPLDNLVAVALQLRRVRGKARQLTEHVRDIGVFIRSGS